MPVVLHHVSDHPTIGEGQEAILEVENRLACGGVPRPEGDFLSAHGLASLLVHEWTRHAAG